jgi:hypothetical protein
MASIARSLFIVIGLVSVLPGAFYGAEPPKQSNGGPATALHSARIAVHIVIRPRTDIKQTFIYSPYPVIESELGGDVGSQVGMGELRQIKLAQVIACNGKNVGSVSVGSQQSNWIGPTFWVRDLQRSRTRLVIRADEKLTSVYGVEVAIRVGGDCA